MKLGKYKHYKGKMYEVIAVGRIESDLSEVVIYKALYESPDFGKDAVWVRPIKNFTEKVNVDGKKVARFAFIGE
jgi:cyclomaltodextrinase / maltogenic alpha-amylase / neopullulanase